MKILIKFPTRGRPDKFFQVLNEYIQKAKDLSKIAFVISMDSDDSTMANLSIRNKFDEIRKKVKLFYFYGQNKSKIEAINADMDNIDGWDILLLASDDMIPVVDGYDEIIRNDMNAHFSDLDGCLWYSDGGQNNICTLSIMGKKYYDRFGYIYNPEYKSLWSDNEYTDVTTQLNKFYKSDQVIIEHQHPVYQKTNYDALYVRNESYFNIDREVYDRRKAINFDLIDKKNVRIKHFTFFTDSHKILLSHFLKTYPFDENIYLTIKNFSQKCISGKYMESGWIDSMKDKISYIIECLKSIDNDEIMVHTDCDIVFAKNFKNCLLEEMGSSDIIFQNDQSTVCLGFFACKKNEKTIGLFERTLKEIHHSENDQIALDKILKSGYSINWKFLSYKFYNYSFYKTGIYEKGGDINFPNDIVVFHTNYTIGVENKLELIEKFYDFIRRTI